MQIYINPLPPNKSKGKSTTAMYSMQHNLTKDFQCGIRSCPPIQNDDILPCFLFPSFFYGKRDDSRGRENGREKEEGEGRREEVGEGEGAKWREGSPSSNNSTLPSSSLRFLLFLLSHPLSMCLACPPLPSDYTVL